MSLTGFEKQSDNRLRASKNAGARVGLGGQVLEAQRTVFIFFLFHGTEGFVLAR
jgi:hypothetical protein